MSNLQRSYSINGLTLAECIYAPRLKQPRHTHSDASFSFVLAGRYVEIYGRRAAETRRAATIVFHPPQESHAVDFQSGAKILSVQFDAARFAYVRERCDVLDASASAQTELIARLGRRIYQEFCQMDAASELAIEGLILEILAAAVRSRNLIVESRSPRWLERATEFLHAHFSESVSLETVAEIADVHPVHLARVFRQKHGCAVGEYVRRLRVEEARRRIAGSDESLADIALAAGFADQSHFARTFKNQTGSTPGEYRKAARAG